MYSSASCGSYKQFMGNFILISYSISITALQAVHQCDIDVKYWFSGLLIVIDVDYSF